MKLENSTALVTGANRGIGREIVADLLGRGVRRIYAGARRVKDLEAIVAAAPDRIVPLQIDITDRPQIKAAAEKARDVTLLINNAGVADFGAILECPLELTVRDMDTNFFGTLNMARAFAPIIEQNGGGAVVNFLTVVALASMPGLGAYNASKAAAWSMTQSIRAGLAPKGIDVHGVFPGPVDTDMIRAVEIDKTDPREVAKAVLDGIASGTEDIFPDPMSRAVYDSWRQDHKAVERQFASM